MTTSHAALLPSVASQLAPDESDTRDRFFDNAKALFMLMVITVHFHIAMTPCGSPIDILIVPLFCVVMPGFSFISGHLTAATLTPPRIVRLLVSLVVLCVWNTIYILQGKFGALAALALVNATLDHNASLANSTRDELANLETAAKAPLVPFDILTIRQVTWFLLALIVWRATLPAVLLLLRPLRVALITLVALAAPFTDFGSSPLSTVFGFWPFFVCGHLVPRERLVAWRASCKLRAVYLMSLLLLAGVPAIPGGTAAIVGLTCLYGQGFANLGRAGANSCREPWALLSLALAYPVRVHGSRPFAGAHLAPSSALGFRRRRTHPVRVGAPLAVRGAGVPLLGRRLPHSAAAPPPPCPLARGAPLHVRLPAAPAPRAQPAHERRHEPRARAAHRLRGRRLALPPALPRRLGRPLEPPRASALLAVRRAARRGRVLHAQRAREARGGAEGWRDQCGADRAGARSSSARR